MANRLKSKKVRFGNRVIGLYYPSTKQFVKRVQRSRHFFWKLRAWGMERAVLEALCHAGCEEIQVRDSEGRECFIVSPGYWLQEGVEQEFGAGKQFFLSRTHFIVKEY